MGYQRKGTDRAAHLISHLLSPAAVALAVFGGLTSWRGWGQYWICGLVGIGFYTVVPGFVLALLKRRGEITGDIYDPPPQMRERILLAGAACYLAGCGSLVLCEAPSVMLWAGATFLCGALLVWVIGKRWKISIHAGGVSGGGTILLAVGGGELWPLVAAVPLVGWARLQRRAHTPAQVVAGLGMGVLLATLLRPLF
jgi:hypothetical protein